MNKQFVELTVNGQTFQLAVDPQWTLLEVLREHLGLTGSKEGCGKGACGACTVLVNGEAVLACLTLAISVDGKSIKTVEGLSKGQELTPLQNSFISHGAIQCGFCTPGMLMASTALLSKNPYPSEDEVKEGISGNLCRCTGYVKIVEAIMATTEE